MKNVQLKVAGDKLTITVDLSKDFGLSRTGKSVTVATTSGNKQLTKKPGTYVGLNVYKYQDDRVASV